MHTLVIYDTNFGNTYAIAQTIAKKLQASAVPVTKVSKKDIADADVLLVGSPINGWRPSEKIDLFLNNLEHGQLRGKKAAAFDTRVKLFIHGDAAGKISHFLEHAGAKIISSPKGFFVKAQQGPLFEKETAKAATWADEIKKLL